MIKLRLAFVALLATTFYTQNISAQLIGGNAYMKGDYVEVAVDANGREGTDEIVGDTTYHFRGGSPGSPWGFCANPQMDGWDEYNGDFFTPGAPECGFGITYTLGGVEYSYGNNYDIFEIPGSITDYTETVDSVLVTWVGMVDSLEMTVLYEIRKDELMYTTTVSLVNLGLNTFTDVYYYHSLDPDNNQSIGGGFPTTNEIVQQSSMLVDSSIVRASQTMPWMSEVFLAAAGEDWKVAYGGFSNRDGNDIWNGTGGLTGIEGSSLFADQAIAIAHKTELIAPGKSTATNFSFATTFAADPRPLAEEDNSNIFEYSKFEVAVYPNPSENGMVNIKVNGTYTYEIINLQGQVILQGTGNNTNVVNLAAFDKGVYFVRVNQNNTVTTKKLILK